MNYFCGPDHWLMLKTTNSAGLTTATPIRNDEITQVATALRVVLFVALNVEGLLWGPGRTAPSGPDALQECADAAK